jgi:hypothetical protein
MTKIRIALALGAAAALALGSAYAQDAAKPLAKPEAKKEEQHRHGGKQHRMQRMGGGCHDQGRGAEHDHRG